MKKLRWHLTILVSHPFCNFNTFFSFLPWLKLTVLRPTVSGASWISNRRQLDMTRSTENFHRFCHLIIMKKPVWTLKEKCWHKENIYILICWKFLVKLFKPGSSFIFVFISESEKLSQSRNACWFLIRWDDGTSMIPNSTLSSGYILLGSFILLISLRWTNFCPK